MRALGAVRRALTVIAASVRGWTRRGPPRLGSTARARTRRDGPRWPRAARVATRVGTRTRRALATLWGRLSGLPDRALPRVPRADGAARPGARALPAVRPCERPRTGPEGVDTREPVASAHAAVQGGFRTNTLVGSRTPETREPRPGNSMMSDYLGSEE
jgi:hypothetical protein